MTLQTIPMGGFWYPRLPTVLSSNPNFLTSSSPTIDAADEAVAFIVQAPKTGTIDSVLWRSETVTTGATLDIRLESVDQSVQPATPSGTLLATDSNGAQVVADTDDNVMFETALTAGVSVTRGDLIAVVIKNPSASFGNMRIGMFADAGNFGIDFPYTLLFTASWASFTTGAPIIAFSYSDSTTLVPEGCYPYKTITNTGFSNSSTPDTRGARFRFPFGVKVTGIYNFIDNDNGATVRLVEDDYHQGNQTGVLASVVMDKDTRQSANGAAHMYELAADVTLDADTYYRLVVEPDTASNVTIYDYEPPNAEVFSALNGAEYHLTTAKDPTADVDWTDYDNGSDGYRIPFLGLKIEAIDIPAPVTVGSLSPAALQSIAQAVLAEPIDNAEADATTKSLLWLIALALNKSSLSGGSIAVRNTADSADLFTQSVTQASATPITAKNEAS